MDAVEFLDKVDRLSKRGSTEEKMRYNDYRTAGDNVGAVKFVKRWAAAHTVKTRQSEFLKLFPNAPIYTNTHNVALDPCLVDTTLRGHCPTGRGCDICRREFWLAEVEDT
jgi:hypothetical protein|uniref:Uncharacterized protein n=1 Tax=Myoviridae sp. ctlnK45 TaxID=2826693 RepID=A0A8S5NNC4_9CAUD|nr:MAG TPA: hypothetical protein [Myoviridae sp. ctlnK45]